MLSSIRSTEISHQNKAVFNGAKVNSFLREYQGRFFIQGFLDKNFWTKNQHQKSFSSISELVHLGETKVDIRVFTRSKRKHLETFENRADDRDHYKDPKKMIELKHLSKNIRFITNGFFDFDEMIWKDRSDGRAIQSSEWYQNDAFYLRIDFKLMQKTFSVID